MTFYHTYPAYMPKFFAFIILTSPTYVHHVLIILCLEMLRITAYPLPCYAIFSWLGCSPYPMRDAPASYSCLMALTPESFVCL